MDNSTKLSPTMEKMQPLSDMLSQTNAMLRIARIEMKKLKYWDLENKQIISNILQTEGKRRIPFVLWHQSAFGMYCMKFPPILKEATCRHSQLADHVKRMIRTSLRLQRPGGRAIKSTSFNKLNNSIKELHGKSMGLMWISTMLVRYMNEEEYYDTTEMLREDAMHTDISKFIRQMKV